MDGKSRRSTVNAKSVALMASIFTNQQFLSLIIVSPVLIWGIWILSEESFDGINATERGLNRFEARALKRLRSMVGKEHFRTLGRESGNTRDLITRDLHTSDLRTRRAVMLPIYFLFLITLTCFIYVMFFIYPQLLRPTLLLLAFSLALFALTKRRKISRQKLHNHEFDAELPTQIQLLTVLISSGVSPARALALLSERSISVSSQRLSEVVMGIKTGESLVEALDNLAQRHQSLVLRRFITSLILGIERGSSLTPILISQVKDARLASKSETLKRAGKAEIGLMIPVVFLILPVSILFALWPSYQQLGSFL